jgi:NADPH:quinone reductase-like Zn-dependent oxidoreductase
MYGVASAGKHPILKEYGATLIDYHTQDFVQVIRQNEPDGLDVVFDGMGGDYLRRGFPLLKRGGIWVSYANPRSFSGLLRLLGHFLWLNLLPNGKAVKLYGTGTSFIDRRPFFADWAALFDLLGEGEISPGIAARFPILEAAKANALLESGEITGNIVLLTPELISDLTK